MPLGRAFTPSSLAFAVSQSLLACMYSRFAILSEMLSGERNCLLSEIDYKHVSLVNNQTSAHTDKGIVAQLFESLVKEMQLECHSTPAPVCEHKVRIVSVGADVNNLFGAYPHHLSRCLNL